MPSDSIYIQKSTVPVGTGKQIEEQFNNDGRKLAYVSNPEFLREGTAVTDSLWFDRIVVGGNNKKANQQVIDLYKSIEKHRDSISKLAKLKGPKNHKGEYFTSNRNSAELIKVTSNAFLALKISFANSIAKLADNADADVVEVMDAVGADKRIGRAFLNAGRGYGGGCFPKDVSGLIASADEHGVEMSIMTAATEVNESMAGYISNKAKDVLGDLKTKKIAVLGLAFKAGTSDARRSPGVKLANILARNGSLVSVYDPKANHEASEDLRRDITICKDINTAIKDADAIFVATAWPEFSGAKLVDWKKLMKGNLLIDCDNSFDPSDVVKAGLEYMGVGRR